MSNLQKLENRIRELVVIDKVPSALPLPVKYDGMTFYWGKGGEMVADFDEGVNVGDGFRIRGWGRIQYSKEEGKTPEQLQDECAFYIERAINAYPEIHLHHVLQAIEETFQRKIFKAVSYDLDIEHHSSSGDEYYNATKIATLRLLKMWFLDQSLSGQPYEVIEYLLTLFKIEEK